MADHTPLIEQLDTWARRLEGNGRDHDVQRVVEEMRQTAADLRADSDIDDEDDDGCPHNDPDCLSRADERRDACERKPNPFGMCGNCGEFVNFEEHDRDLCRSKVVR